MKIIKITITCFIFLLLFSARVFAGEDDNIRGMAKLVDEDIFIYFNCLDEDAGSFPYTFTFEFSIESCNLTFTPHDIGDDGYGVNLENNIFSGHARTSKTEPTGLISFQDGIPATENYNILYNNCDGVDVSNCNSTNNCSACYSESDQKVYGWAKVIDDEEFISLHDGDPRGVSILLNTTPGDFRDYASHPSWGQISFNCFDEGNCVSQRDYKVYRWDLKVRELSAPNWSPVQACSNALALKADFRWELYSGNQTHFEIQVNTENSTSTATSTGKIYSSASSFACPGPLCGDFDEFLDYGTSYYWWLKLYDDDNGQETPWYQFDHSLNFSRLTDNQDFNTINSLAPDLTFTTYRHQFPSPFFDWLPTDIIAGTSTDFFATSTSAYYSPGAPTVAIPCINDTCASDFLWSSNSDAVILSPDTATTSIFFTETSSGQSITLSITDPTGYTCSRTRSIGTINYNLPLWREVKP